MENKLILNLFHVYYRAPIVAKCDRKRVLSSWAPVCRNIIPKEFELQFSQVRNLSPQKFVEKLSEELGVCGVVAGTLSSLFIFLKVEEK